MRGFSSKRRDENIVSISQLYDIGELYLAHSYQHGLVRADKFVIRRSNGSNILIVRKIRPVSTDYHGFNDDRINSRPFVIRVKLKEKLPVQF